MKLPTPPPPTKKQEQQAHKQVGNATSSRVHAPHLFCSLICSGSFSDGGNSDPRHRVGSPRAVRSPLAFRFEEGAQRPRGAEEGGGRRRPRGERAARLRRGGVSAFVCFLFVWLSGGLGLGGGVSSLQIVGPPPRKKEWVVGVLEGVSKWGSTPRMEPSLSVIVGPLRVIVDGF